MRKVLLLLGLAAVTSAWSWRERPQGDAGAATKSSSSCKCQFIGGPDDDAMLTARQDGQDLHLNQLEKEIAALEDEYRALVKRGRSFVRGVRGDEARVERIEGSGCSKKEFGCGGDTGKCVSAIHVCDGVYDCPNNMDEEAELCKNPADVGAVFEAELDGNDPCTIRKPNRIRIAILTSQAKDFFPSVTQVRASIVLTYNIGEAVKTDTLTTSGYYTFGKHALVLYPPDIPDDNRLMIALIFDGADDNLARGIIFHEASKDVCIRFGVRRIDH